MLTSILCTSKKGLRRERQHPSVCVCVFFLWRTVIQQRRAVSVLQEAVESQLYISTEFYYILLSSLAAQGFLSVAEIYLFICPRRKKLDDMWGQENTHLFKDRKVCLICHVRVYSFCAVTRKHKHTQWRYSASDNGFRLICLNKRQTNDKRHERCAEFKWHLNLHPEHTGLWQPHPELWVRLILNDIGNPITHDNYPFKATPYRVSNVIAKGVYAETA